MQMRRGAGAGWPHPEPGREGGPSCTGEASWAFSHPCMGREGESVQTAGGVGVGRQGHHTGPLHRATTQDHPTGPPRRASGLREQWGEKVQSPGLLV